jgi:hypothetical protein
MKLLSLLTFVLLSLSSVAQDKKSTIEVDVQAYKDLSYGAFFKSLTLHSDAERGLEYISGFDFEWGYVYKLKVRKTILQSPPEDASNTTYELIKVISKTPVDEGYEFKLSVERDVYLGPGDQESMLVMVNDSTYRYDDDINLVVPEKLKISFLKRIDSGRYHQAPFEFIDNENIRLLK